MKKILENMHESARKLNEKNILDLIDPNPSAKIIDLGCDDGSWTIQLVRKAGVNEISGIDIVDERIEKALKKGVIAKKGDLNQTLPIKDETFDVVHANQVIEHVTDIDNFVSEIYRILKPGGYTIISTENGSSWHNIFASIMGWQIFSLTNFSSKQGGIGNPLALHRGVMNPLHSWNHKIIFNYLGLKELFEAYGFVNVKIREAGYYPFPTFLGKIDVLYSHFITLKAYKSPKKTNIAKN